ncbi:MULTISPECIES: DNA polymerase III subunit alpha [unclassified Flavobacterium]|uniref:DNA polymerase III subunit alpha n=1 Tax=unclassified Flavobacterium TaxID=196869 RepID=UPI00058049EA|nr:MULTISPECIES: DNA polymerase III subunit alpha [unclassified Flavobacterium]KIA95644.1 DNA polymerase III subunit alpha [Flavobacterium sp. KMS]OUL62825.1 DNA polymerase III subunit alpha [Flavobacterium sp. AJR]
MYLNCHSFHSLRYGTIPLNELVQQAVACNVKAMALTDINTVTGIYDFIKACKEVNIKPIVGMELRCEGQLRYITLARNRSGLGQMNRFLTQHNFDGTPLPFSAPNWEDIVVLYPLENIPDVLKENEYIAIRSEQLPKLFHTQWKALLHKMVILQPVTFRTKREFNLHRILRAIDTNVLLSKLTEDDICKTSEVMIAEEQLLVQFGDYSQIIANTQKIIEDCNFEFDFKTPKNKKFYTQGRETDIALLTQLALEGLLWRYGADNLVAKARVEKELKVIDELQFSGYFLITWDIIQYSNSCGFLHIGRGSGANSIVSYCLGITDICPIELDLYFERFLNLNRKTPPDFDIDWSWKERNTILEYIFKRYGADYVAFCGTNVEFKYRSIFREVGKVFGLPKEELDMLAKNPMALHETNTIVKYVQEYGMLLEKYPNQRSMHSCGIIISEEPITNYTPLEMPPKGFPIVLFDMHIAEDIGFEKFDILSQRGIGHIDDSVKLIQKNRGITVDIRDTALSKDEALCNTYLATGKTIGCFYIESPAMRGLLRRLNCDNYKILVAASSIIRPGVAQSGMMKEYIFRHNHPDKFEYFHPVFKEQLGETYGIMVYQEDVIKIALHYGGLPAADGDILRRAMSGKGRSIAALQKVKDNFFASCLQKGHSVQLSHEIYRQIESFAGYSFCKAHSASYAVESYQSLYLKVHYPVEFMVAVINNQGGFYRTEVYVHEAKMSGATLHNPCVNKSDYETTLYGTDVYLGFMHLEGLETKLAQQIIKEREAHGDFLSLENFINRIPIGIEGIQILIFIGAFRFTGQSKNQLLVIARLILVNFKPENKNLMLLQEPVKTYKLPVLERSAFEDAFDEIELLSFPVSCTPFDLLQTQYRGSVLVKDLLVHHKKTVKMLAYLISRKHVPTKRGTMYFGTWIDNKGDYFDTVHFPDSLAQYPFLGGGCYLLLGIVEVDYHFPTVTITKMAKMPFIPDPRYSNTNDRQFKVHEQIREDVSMTHRAPYPSEHEINIPRQKMN